MQIKLEKKKIFVTNLTLNGILLINIILWLKLLWMKYSQSLVNPAHTVLSLIIIKQNKKAQLVFESNKISKNKGMNKKFML